MKFLNTILMVIVPMTAALAQDVSLADFVNALNRSRNFEAREVVEIIREYDSKYECEEMVSGAIWNEKRNQCEFSESKSAEISMREDGKFDLFLIGNAGCTTSLVLRLASTNENSLGREVLIGEASISNYGEDSIYEVNGAPLLRVIIESKKRFRIEDSGFGALECGTNENFNGIYKQI